MAKLITTRGAVGAEQLGLILPHEHIFVDLGPIAAANWRHAQTEQVIPLMGPELARARAAGVTALVECTPMGVAAAWTSCVTWPLHWIFQSSSPPASIESRGCLKSGAGSVPGRADRVDARRVDRPNRRERRAGRIDQAECRRRRHHARGGQDFPLTAAAARQTHAAIGSHTIRQHGARQTGHPGGGGIHGRAFHLDPFQAEPDFALHLELARQGCWIEYDAIGSDGFTDAWFIDAIRRVLDAGLGHRLLLSHDRGWYDPSQAGGGIPKPFTYLSEEFLPKLAAAGVDEETIRQLTVVNPFAAFAR